MQDSNEIVFVEVRLRSNNAHGRGLPDATRPVGLPFRRSFAGVAGCPAITMNQERF